MVTRRRDRSDWGPHEMADGVFRVTLPSPRNGIVSAVNCYLLQGAGNEFVLVDSGWNSTGRRLVEALRNQFGSRVAMRELVLSHLHPDHFGGAQEIDRAFSPEVRYHSREKSGREGNWLISKSIPSSVGVIALGVQAAEVSISARISRQKLPPADSYLEDGDQIEAHRATWRVLHTPGHTPGHISLYDESRKVMIGGDHILPSESSNIGFFRVSGYNPLKAYLTSLARIRRLGVRVLFPAHGERITNVRGRIDELFAHHRGRLREVFEAMRGGAGTAPEVASSVRWSRGPLQNLTNVHKWLAISETISHLEFLRACRVTRRQDKPAYSYKLIDADWAVVEAEIRELSDAA